MSDFSNITVTPTEDGMLNLLIDGKAISEKYGMKFDPSILDDLKALENGQNVNLFEQFVFSHTDLNFEHRYQYVLCIVKQNDRYETAKSFVYRITAEGQPPVEHVITKQGAPMTEQDVREFIQAHLQKSLTDYTDLQFAY